MTLGAYIIVRNEADLLMGCAMRLLPYVDELLIVDHASTDKTVDIMNQLMQQNKKVKIGHHSYSEPVNMGNVRTSCYRQMTSDWVMNVDADEYYPPETMAVIRAAVDKPGEAISFRLPYFNLAWQPGYVQDEFEHYPDRIYLREAVDAVVGLLPNDMHHVKKEFYAVRPILEYDNPSDISFENPKQPILKHAPYYHLARTRGYWFEYTKWFRYNKNLHPLEPDYAIESSTRMNQWVTGLYSMRPITVPDGIPTKNIRYPKVSIIIPNFQYKDFVGDAIQSCLDQTYLVHEIIVVDDGSHDNSPETIKEWLPKDSRIQLIEQPNGGVAAARNNGISKSTGDYFICLDADDKLAPTYVEQALAKMIGNVQIVFTDIHMFGDVEYDITEPDFSSKTLKENQCVPSACALIDRHVFEASGGFAIDEWYEDYGWWLRLDQLGFRFAQIHEPLFWYRKHGESRITMLDKKQKHGFQQLAERYGKIIPS